MKRDENGQNAYDRSLGDDTGVSLEPVGFYELKVPYSLGEGSVRNGFHKYDPNTITYYFEGDGVSPN